EWIGGRLPDDPGSREREEHRREEDRRSVGHAIQDPLQRQRDPRRVPGQRQEGRHAGRHSRRHETLRRGENREPVSLFVLLTRAPTRTRTRSGTGTGAGTGGRVRGLTLVEVLITVALIALVTGAAVLAMGVTEAARLKRSSVMIASAVRTAYAHA